MVSQDEEKAPLLTFRVLDLVDEKACFCSKLLADMGAGVIKVEKPGGDASRQIGPFLGKQKHPEKSLSFWYNNTGKLGITLNLENETGRGLFLRLVRKADVIVESFPPGYLAKIGLGYEKLGEYNPGLILASVTGFGQEGPYKLHKSCDIVAAASGGQMYVNGDSGSSPLALYGQQTYYTASLFAAIGILLALRERRQSGRGQHLDISLQEAAAATLEHVMVRYFYEKIVPGRRGNLHWNNSAGLLPCRDGYIFITFDREWETLVELLDSEGMARDLSEERWRQASYRRQHVDHIIETLSAWTKTHSTDELFQLGQLMRFPWAPVSSVAEMFRSPQLSARDFFVEVEHPEVGNSYAYPGTPCRLSNASWKIRKRAPLIGEHNTQVYRQELGISDEELRRFSASNVI